MKKEKIFRGLFSDFLFIVFEGILAALGGVLISKHYFVAGTLSFLSFFIVGFIISNRKQNKILFGTSETPGSASNFPEGTIYMRHKK